MDRNGSMGAAFGAVIFLLFVLGVIIVLLHYNLTLNSIVRDFNRFFGLALCVPLVSTGSSKKRKKTKRAAGNGRTSGWLIGGVVALVFAILLFIGAAESYLAAQVLSVFGSNPFSNMAYMQMLFEMIAGFLLLAVAVFSFHKNGTMWG